MCGIAGIAYENHERCVDPRLVERMTEAIRTRGPDDSGVWTSGGVGLGHRRLSIIDLTSSGHQPMTNEDETVWLVFNGEIYNFAPLRDELKSKGHQFRSRTDSEVIVHLYEEEGAGCFERLDGMFAIAIWDEPRRRLILARDRLGKKPLKYAQLEGGIAFASELKAILATDLVDREVDLADVDLYLSLGYVPDSGTGFRHIRKLPPAHRLVWEAGRTSIEPYWSLDYRRKRALSLPEWKEQVGATVRSAVRRRMVSDVPLGAFLSGGIDSSIVVACMAEASDRPIETFSIGFEHESYNELPHARRVAEWCGTHHHEFVVRADDASLLPELARLYEEPFSDSSALPTWFLCRETRRHVTVALSGDGGDEGFFGYDRYERLQRLIRRLRPLRLPGLALALQAIAGAERMLPPALVRNLDGLAGLLHPELAVQYLWMVRQMSDREKDRLAGEPLLRARRRRAAEVIGAWVDDPRAGSCMEDRISFADVVGYLPGHVLTKVDLASMAHGLEVRAPLLDHHVLELTASAPPEVRYRNRSLKYLLKETFAGTLPPGLFDRPKSGFGIPLQEWFRGPLEPIARDLLLGKDARVHAYLRPDSLREIVDQHVAGRVARGFQLWSLLMLELWHRQVAEPAVAQSAQARPAR